MGPETIFHVLTEFRFEVGEAVLNTEQLKGSVEELSGAADQALTSFQRLGFGIVAQFGMGSGGILGSLYTAIKAADKFRMSQIAMANLMGQGTPFNERLEIAAGHMQKINKLASEFALPADDLLMMTKLTAPMLRTTGKNGQIGAPNFPLAIDISRNILKAAPTLNVQPTMIMGELQRMISGHASMNDTLFQRLTSDSTTLHGVQSHQFNAMPEAQRIQKLRAALGEFTKDTSVLEANVNTLNGQMTLLKNNISGAVGLLSEIGQQILKLVVPALKELNAFLGKEGKIISDAFSSAIEPWMEGGWRKMVVNFMQIKSLFGDVTMASHILGFIGSVLMLHGVMGFLKIKIPYATAALDMFAHSISKFETDVLKGALSSAGGGALGKKIASMIAGGGFTGIFANIFKYADLIVVFVSRLLAPLVLLVGVFQLFSRASAIAKMNTFDAWMKAIPGIAEIVRISSRMFAFLLDGFDSIASFIAPLFETIFVPFLSDIADFILFFVNVIGLAIAGFQGLTLAILEFFNQIKSFVTGGGFDKGKIGDAFDYGMNDTFEKIFGKIKNGEGGVATMTTNIGKVEINNAFKEQMQPDRVAFTMKEQIMKAALNPQGQGRSMAGKLATQ